MQVNRVRVLRQADQAPDFRRVDPRLLRHRQLCHGRPVEEHSHRPREHVVHLAKRVNPGMRRIGFIQPVDPPERVWRQRARIAGPIRAPRETP